MELRRSSKLSVKNKNKKKTIRNRSSVPPSTDSIEFKEAKHWRQICEISIHTIVPFLTFLLLLPWSSRHSRPLWHQRWASCVIESWRVLFVPLKMGIRANYRVTGGSGLIYIFFFAASLPSLSPKTLTPDWFFAFSAVINKGKTKQKQNQKIEQTASRRIAPQRNSTFKKVQTHTHTHTHLILFSYVQMWSPVCMPKLKRPRRKGENIAKRRRFIITTGSN